MRKITLKPTENQNFILLGGDFSTTLETTLRLESEGDFEGACDTRYKAFQQIVEVLAEFVRTGKVSPEKLTALRRHRHLCEELCAAEHPADEAYLKDISSERPTQQALAREMYLRCEPLILKYEGFVDAVK